MYVRQVVIFNAKLTVLNSRLMGSKHDECSRAVKDVDGMSWPTFRCLRLERVWWKFRSKLRSMFDFLVKVYSVRLPYCWYYYC